MADTSTSASENDPEEMQDKCFETILQHFEL